MVTVRAFGHPRLKELLDSHPLVLLSSFEEHDKPKLEFETNRSRIAYHGRPDLELYGLTELMDNNPLVCADAASVTGPEATLALIGLGPLAKAELLVGQPAIAFNFATRHPEEVDAALATEGWKGGAAIASSDEEPSVLRAECIAEITLPGSSEDVWALYEECFGRSFFVRESSAPPTENDAHATYTIHLEEHGDGTALAKIVVASAREGKCGSGGLVHIFNVMAGYEESLGVAGLAGAMPN